MIETTFEFETSGLREEAKRIGLKEGREEGIREGRKEGIREGRLKGIEEGRREEKLETVSIMIKEGLALPLIKKITGLTEQQILNMQMRLNK